MEKFLNADEARLLSQTSRKSLPSEEVVNLANRQIKKAATSGFSRASFPCPREEAPYLRQRLELFGYFILIFADSHTAPIYTLNVYWDELQFLNDRTLTEKKYSVVISTHTGFETLKSYLPEDPYNVTKSGQIADDPRYSKPLRRRSN